MVVRVGVKYRTLLFSGHVIKSKKKVYIFLSAKGADGGGGQSLADMSAKIDF